ncbi:hypothetical protein Tco_0965611 [Tanacetum coccineum]
MFDVYLNPPPCVDPQVPTVIVPEPAILTGAPSSPSKSTSQTHPKTPSPVIPLGVEEADHDIEVTHMDNNPFIEFLETNIQQKDKNEAKNDKTEHGMEKREKVKVNQSQPRQSQQSKTKP